jgi:hypothetical protein
MNVLKRGTVARAVPTVKGLSSAGVKQAMSYGPIGAAARLWVRGVGTWLGGPRTKHRKARCPRAQIFAEG